MSLLEYSPCWARKVAALYQALRKLPNMQFIFSTWKSVTKPSYMTYPHILQSKSLSLHIMPKSCCPCNCIIHLRQHSVSHTSGGTLQAHRLDYILYLLFTLFASGYFFILLAMFWFLGWARIIFISMWPLGLCLLLILGSICFLISTFLIYFHCKKVD